MPRPFCLVTTGGIGGTQVQRTLRFCSGRGLRCVRSA